MCSPFLIGKDGSMKGLEKRIFCSLLALCVVAAAVFSCPLRVQATGALSAEGSVESLMSLLDILVNASAAAGATEYVADYDHDMALLDAFSGFVWSLYPGGAPPELDATFYMEDGTMVTFSELLDDVEDGTLTLPNEQQWGQYRVGFGDDFASILEAWEGRGSGSGGGSSQEPEDPDFSTLETLGISAGFMGMVGEFLTALRNDEIEGLDPEIYFDLPEKSFTVDDFKEQSSGHLYTFSGSAHFYISHLKKDRHMEFTGETSGRAACYFDGTHLRFYKQIENNEVTFLGFVFTVTDTDSSGTKTYTINSSTVNCSEYSCSLPVFSDYDAVKNYLTAGTNYKDALNYKPIVYDYPALAANISPAFAPWTNTRISPSTFQKTYAAVKDAYETQIKPQTDTSAETETDTQANTEIYTQTVNKVITENLVQPETGPGTGTKPDPKPDPPGTTTPGTGTETSPDEDVDEYKRDLRMIFPFCLPFDLIGLFNALEAEPVAPCFEFPFVVEALDIDMMLEFDLSFLDDVAEMIRFLETISLIIGLITLTHKMIKW